MFEMVDKMKLRQGIMQVTLSLYNEQVLPRNAVQIVVENMGKFISEYYIPFLHTKLIEEFDLDNDKEVCDKIEYVLENNQFPFEEFATERNRFQMYRQYGGFVLPEKYTIGREIANNVVSIVEGTHIPLEYSLKQTLEIPGVMEEIKMYMNNLYEEQTVISNIIQGKFWRDKFGCTTSILPIILYYDDFEPGNALGSHSGEQQLGGVYMSLPVLPPHMVAKLDNIFITSVFYSKHRKTLGNYNIFYKVIEDINSISTNGIELNINGIKETIYFQCVLFVGDNLGLNAACGFVESFGNCLRYCRICRATSEQCQILCEEDVSLLRNRENYETDLQETLSSRGSYDTGIKESCIFNSIQDYHITENASIDIMHDICEGVAYYTISKILTQLIYEHKLFTLDTLNKRIKEFNYGVDEINKPRAVLRENSKKVIKDKIKNKIKLKQSTAEMLCLSRYLGALIGNLVPESNKYWKLYLILRSIIGIVLSPRYVIADISQVKYLIRKHNEMYVQFFGPLKPKMHFSVHIPQIMLKFGPLVHFWCMPFERKNKQLKDVITNTTSHRNAPYTICIKNQLRKCFFSYQVTQIKGDVSFGSVDIEKDVDIQKFIPLIPFAKSYNFITVLGKSLSNKSTIVIKVTDDGPIFGKIRKIFEINGYAYILVAEIVCIYFKFHFYAYKVQINETSLQLLNVDSLPKIDPCTLININNDMYVLTRYDV